MLLEKIIKINNIKLKQYYKNLGYDVSSKYSIINIIDLPKSSHVEVNVKCDVCQKIKKTKYYNYYKNTDGLKEDYCCSKKCSNNKCKKRLQNKYGVNNVFQLEEIKKKSKKTLIDNYGVDHPMHSEKIRQKLINTNLEKYGYECGLSSYIINEKKENTNLKKYGYKTPFLNNHIKNKIKKKLIDNYGVEHPMHSEKIRQKLINTNLEKYGYDNVSKNQSIRLKISKNLSQSLYLKNIKLYEKKYKIKIINYHKPYYTILCNNCHNEFIISSFLLQNRLINKSTTCTYCNPINPFTSDKELQLLNFIKEKYNGIIIENDRKIINPYELDIYLPDLNLAFEFNGLYWHNELYKDNNYHKMKTDLCLEKGIQLIHVYEDDWNNKQDIIKSMILNKLGVTNNKIFARKTEIKEISDNKIVKEFLKNNHIQGHINSSVKISLFYDNKLVSLMTFGKLRKSMNSKSNNEEYEMLRFCSKLNTNVIGGASKLFKYFLKQYNPSNVISYVDRGYSNGNLYKRLGFKLVHITDPNYYYIIDNNRKHRFGFRKDILIKQGFDKNKSEHEIMFNRNIYKIYNSGNYKFKY